MLAAAVGLCFTFEKKSQGPSAKPGNLSPNSLQILSFFTLNLLVLNLLGRMQPIIPYQMLPCLKSTAITFNFLRV